MQDTHGRIFAPALRGSIAMNKYGVPLLAALPLFHQGKSRDTHVPIDPSCLLVVATRRISTHNIVHASTIPGKGEVLTALTIFWLKDVLEKIGIAHHLVAFGKDIYGYLPGAREDYPANLHHQAIVVKRLVMTPVEFVYRSYLTGSLYRDYYAKGITNPYGLRLQEGLQNMSPFSAPKFTPTDKSETDDPISWLRTKRAYPTAFTLGNRIYVAVQQHLRSKGLELVDTKFEFSDDNTLADEVATPDSSRICELSKIVLGKDPPWLDKQVARDEAERLWGGGPKTPIAFSPEVITQVSQTYRDVFKRITGVSLEQFQVDRLD